MLDKCFFVLFRLFDLKEFSFVSVVGKWMIFDLAVGHLEMLLLGLLVGLVLAFLSLSLLSGIRPYLFCSFWFISLLLLYSWRSGFVFILFPSLESSSFQRIYFFVLQSIPVIIYLILTKTVTVLQTKNYVKFQRVFSSFLWFSVSYLVVVLIASLFNAGLLLDHFDSVQRLFYILVGLLGIPSLAWLVFSSQRNLNFYKFQISFGLFFAAALVAKFLFSSSGSSAAFFKPEFLLFGILGQLIYMFWLLLTSIFGSQNMPSEAEIILPQKKVINEVVKGNTGHDLLKNLSSREKDIIIAYCNGFTYNEISSSFLISPNTVKSHLKSCYRKLKINSKVEAISIVNRSREGR